MFVSLMLFICAYINNNEAKINNTYILHMLLFISALHLYFT